MLQAELAKLRSNCMTRHVGAVIVRNHRQIATGYNGTPPGVKNCFDGGCKRCNSDVQSGELLDTCICLHAEENALLFVSKNELYDATLYVTLIPCIGCCKKILQCNIKKIIFGDYYNKELDQITMKIFLDNNIEISRYNTT